MVSGVNRFDSIAYDAVSFKQRDEIKALFRDLELAAEAFSDPGSRHNFLLKLQEAYVWAGLAIRDTQLKRNRESGYELPSRGQPK